MDYKEKYEQAIKRANAILEVADNREEAFGYVSTIFPELAESEDEGIRKRLIAMCQHYIECYALDQYNLDGYKEALAWLEKQCELQEGCVRKQVAEAKEALYNKPTWSEEDEKVLSLMQKIVRDSDVSAKKANELSDWLKSLKERLKME